MEVIVGLEVGGESCDGDCWDMLVIRKGVGCLWKVLLIVI